MTIKDKANATSICRNTAKELYESCGGRTILPKAFRHGLFLLQMKLHGKDGLEFINSELGGEIAWDDRFSLSIRLSAEDAQRLKEIKELLPYVKSYVITELALREYLKASLGNELESQVIENSTLELFDDDAYNKEIPIIDTQYKLILSRYTKNEIGAVVRAALTFFAEGYEYFQPWAEPSSITTSDRNFFNPKTESGKKRLAESTNVQIYFYKSNRADLAILKEDFKLPINNIIRVCLDRYLNLPGWKQRKLNKPKSLKALSPTEDSKSFDVLVDTEIFEDLKKDSANGKPQNKMRCAIKSYLNHSTYALKTEPNPNYIKTPLEKTGVKTKRVSLHLPLSEFDKLTIAATWENCSRNHLLDTIFQDYLKSLREDEESPRTLIH